MDSSLRKIYYIFVGIFALIIAICPANGEIESVVLGDYEVSFDLDTSSSHTIEVQPPIIGENDTNYGAYIKFSNDTQILMGIDVFNTAKDATLEPELELVQVYARGDENTTVTTRSVDGRMGIQTSSISKSGDPSFTFRSWIDSQKCECGEVYAGSAKLEILGIVPTNISENLLNSLHVASMADAIAPEQAGSLTGTAPPAAAQAAATVPSQISASSLDSTQKAYAEKAWLDSFYPSDPAYWQLHAWANM